MIMKNHASLFGPALSMTLTNGRSRCRRAKGSRSWASPKLDEGHR
jgi:hypothetical protein